MLLRPEVLAAVADGRVDLAYRRWDRPRVRAGGHQRTAIGLVAFDEVRQVAREDVTDADARRAGFADASELLRFLDRRRSGEIYRVALRLAGPDPRVALREAIPGADEMEAIGERLERLDRASRHGPWTIAVMRAIAERPETRAADLAASFGRERLAFKADVRKLKELGLTESLEIGYRLSPRGRAVLERFSAGPRPGQRRTPPSRRRRRGGR